MIPHCDSSVLHAPTTCEYCDARPEWQEYRQLARINFTGEDDPQKAPCPSTFFRPLETIEQWGGNRSKTPDHSLWEQYNAIQERYREGECF